MPFLMFKISKTRKNLPKFPPKKINKKKDQVVEQRKLLLASKYTRFQDFNLDYINELCNYFNIFDDKDVIEFIQMKGKSRLFYETLGFIFRMFNIKRILTLILLDKEYMRQYFQNLYEY